ncbi:DUF6443 domain-containing protein [Psychroserpens algicola]|uniref:RHS repeat-associated core domain-containing protein n=1 Tax=Psychroserpens algicola TaxID=1719034 RepID=A0ABT0H3S2_9FLAO|nr:DUF6443 domain-containing protein [Psychroserpens algicola]MCK8479024.1 RHS repeat-associated core domain-containing protein [Psychroserpens algicola]
MTRFQLLIFITVLLFQGRLEAQSSNSPIDLPAIIPPTPTVSSLMSFEEVPVSYYTGQPNITIPLYSKDIGFGLTMPFSLNYSTTGVRIDERSSWVGTGWSLQAGGVISRTVRGIPDEEPIGGVGGNRTGVFHLDTFWDYYDSGTTLFERQKFLWEANGSTSDRYDYELDTFQFNVLGMSGSFILVKSNGTLEAKLLDKNQRLKIDINYGDGSNPYKLNFFTITDTNGNIYTFNQKEILTSEHLSQMTLFNNTYSSSGQNDTIISTNAWYLTSIESSNGELLATFDYVDDFEQYSTSYTRTTNEIINRDSNYNTTIADPVNAGILKPKVIASWVTSSGNSQKLSKITFEKDGSYINFGLGTIDHPETGGDRLSYLSIRDKHHNENKKFTLNYEDVASRMWLTNVEESAGGLTNDYDLEYNDKHDLPPFNSPSDDWGYNDGASTLTVSSANCTVGGYYDYDAITVGLLRKISYPTGGDKEFIFEQNTISYQGDESSTTGTQLTNNVYRELNPENWNFDTFTMTYPGPSNAGISLSGSFVIPQEQDIIFKRNMTVTFPYGTSGNVQDVYNDTYIEFFDASNTSQGKAFFNNPEYILTLPAGTYTAKLTCLYSGVTLNLNSCLAYNKYQTTVKRYIYGGGVRIKDIIFNDENGNDAKKTSYYYNEINTGPLGNVGQPNPNLSSGTIDGSLSGLLREYELLTNPYLCTPSNGPRYKVRAKIPTTQLTKGSYVGYKTVRVSESQNGSRVMEYTTARDYPSPDNVFQYPYVPAPTLDYKRGLLLSEIVYKEPASQFDTLGDTLQATFNEYETEKYQVGLNYAIHSNEGSTKQFYNSFSAFSSAVPDQYPGCNPQPIQQDCTNDPNCSNMPFFAVSDTIFSTWVKLKQRTVRDYFHGSSGTSQTETRQEFTYNGSNYQISEQKTIYDKAGVQEELKTKYYYALGGLPQNYGTSAMISRLQVLNKLDEIVSTQTYKDDVLISQVNTRYFEPETNLVLPNSIQTIKGSDSPEDRLVFHKYDSYGNPLEVSKKDGTRIMYVWGYENTYPIAKIVNHSYIGISTSLQNAIDDAITASNADNTSDVTSPTGDDALRIELEDLRTHSDLADAQVITFTYNPLVGVTSMIDARGYMMFYEYDDLNRLKNVKDVDGYILSKNDYYYGTPLSYVQTTGFQVKTLNGNTNAITSANLTDDDKIESITYLDGLGRSLQTIAKQAGGDKQDIIVPFEYDAIGRSEKQYLPYANKNQTPGTGSLSYRNHTTLLTDIEDYYLNEYSEDQISPTAINAFSQQRFERSPLNRVLEQGAPGKDWLINPTQDTDHTIKMDYQTNAANEVAHYRVIFPTLDTEQPQLYYDGYYKAEELYKTITKNENWNPNSNKLHTTEEFKNKQGQIILKRTYGRKNGLLHDTHYVYDDFGNLTYVLSPKGSDLVLNSESYNSFTDEQDYTTVVPLDKKGDPITTGNGDVTVVVDASTNEIEVRFSLSLDTASDLKTGPVFQLSQTIPDMIIGTMTPYGSNYTISIQDGYLYIAGSGAVQSLGITLSANLPSASIQGNVVDDLCYQYHYDKRNRLVEKKIPQKGWEYVVYDELDRPLMTQDAMQRSKSPREWSYTKYDRFDRVAYTGIYTTSLTSRSSVQITANNSSLKSVTSSSSPNTIDGISIYYSGNVFPSTNLTLHTVNYYDDYNTTLSGAFSNPGTTFGQTVTNENNTLSTGSLIRVLGTNDWITSVMYYDDKGQPIFTGSNNDYLDTTDEMKSEFDFVGKILKTENSHTKGINNTIVVTDRFTYDHASRLKTHKQQITGQSEELIAKNTYDELGQLVIKDVGNTEANPLQNIDYNYNIRGWLSEINDVNSLGTDLFTFKINYNHKILGQTNVPLYNGNISETIWKTKNDYQFGTNITRGYGYHYDGLNRLKTANMSTDTGSGFGLANAYNTNGVQYDKNGNIVALRRIGETATFDDLVYSYDGNQLSSVTDLITNQQTEGFIDGNTVGDDYDYDANGNITFDKNKGVTTITYNHLNLPTQVEFNNSSSENIDYIYDATGLKMKKVVNDNGNITSTEYAGNFVYENSVLKLFSHPEGYVEPDGINYQYIYQYKDHLGNIRVSYKNIGTTTSLNLEIQEENNYYPFGLKHKGYNNVVTSTNPAQKYKFGGKELNDELGLDWYDFGARNYDAALGRWMNIDPMAEKFYYDSPYTYATNNPIYYIDPDGMEWVRYDEDGNKQTIYDPSVENEDGTTGAYTEHATDQDKELGNNLRQSKTGESQFQELVTSETAIVVEVNETDKKIVDGELVGGQTVTETNSKGEEYEKITIYTAASEFQANDVNEITSKGYGADLDGVLIYESVSADDFTAQSFGHEIGHTTKQNRKLRKKAGKNPTRKQRKKIEKKPSDIGNKILDERTK